MKVARFAGLVLMTLLSSSVQSRASETGLLTPISTASGTKSTFVVFQNIRLEGKDAGMSGVLQILQDTRVTPAYRRAWGWSADPRIALGRNNPVTENYETHPLQNGRIRLLDQNGQTMSEDSFTEPLGRIDIAYLYGTDAPTYMLSVDYGIGWGSYAGPATTLIEIHNRHLVQLPVMLSATLKSGWRIIQASTGSGKVIEQVQCHLNWNKPESDEFVVDYSTYAFVNGQWRKATVERPGMWEADDNWPPASSFP